MSVECQVKAVVDLSGLRKTLQVPFEWLTTSTPTKYTYLRQVQNTTNVAEALNIGDVTTPLLIGLVSISKEVDIDTNFVSTFKSSLTCNPSEGQIFMPAGTVYIKNHTAGETATVEFIVVGT